VTMTGDSCQLWTFTITSLLCHAIMLLRDNLGLQLKVEMKIDIDDS
jgi:hypothetical protein